MRFVKIILASASPRRQELLRKAGIPFEVHPAEVDEMLPSDEQPGASVMRLAELKASAVARQYSGMLVLGADTLVVLDGKTLGKPADLADAHRMLQELSGRTHEVLTGVSLVQDGQPADTWCCRTLVTFNTLDAEQIDAYFQLVNPLDKAGAYAIQEHGSLLVESIQGLLSNVIGLPVEEVVQKLQELQQ